jgi:XTP/dITP diphosphohydrolase
VEIVLATRNEDKVVEIRRLLAPIDLEVLSLDDFGDAPEVIEDGAGLRENALKKAREIRSFTGLSALADDSGLEVDALGGEPGVFSSRYAGPGATYEDNNRKLLRELEGVAPPRRARFRCCMALALVNNIGDELYGRLDPGARIGAGVEVTEGRIDALVTEGILPGEIILERRGTSGFGYDPVFLVPGENKTLAELGLETKNRMSHRYRAAVEMREFLLRLGLAGERGLEAGPAGLDQG